MPLLSFWKADPAAIRQLTIAQVVATAGDGRLKDASECQRELREFLREAPVPLLEVYAAHCLEEPFDKSGQVLQDIVNELGRRLEYDVANGRYQGTANAIGYDGLWKDPTGQSLVVEVKTTDAYRLSLETLSRYRQQLIDAGTIDRQSSILIVVGRQDTGELEAQVRGSRYAWDIRLISVDALLQLVRTKEAADSPDTISKIRRLLTPLEYTRLDQLVEVVFSAAQDVEHATATELPDAATTPDANITSSSWQFTPAETIQAKRDDIVRALSAAITTPFIRKSRAMYWDPDGRQRLVCTVSKRYDNQGPVKYWYAYHPAWHDFLLAGSSGWFALGCVDLDVAFAIPVNVMSTHLGDFHTTAKADGSGEYYHIKIAETEAGGFALQLPRANGLLPLEAHCIVLRGAA